MSGQTPTAANLIGAPSAQPVSFVLFGVLFGVLLIAALFDLRTRRIPNLLTFPGALLAMGLHAAGGGSAALLSSASAYLIFLLIGFVLYSTVLERGIGAGDLKLLATCAAFLGWMPALYLGLYSFAAHVLWMIAGWFMQGVARRNFAALLRWLLILLTPRLARVPFVPEGTPERSPHAPFVLIGAAVLHALWAHGAVVP
jgi:prepilin peptidase CpaA